MSGCCRWAENFSFTHSFSFKRFKTVLFCFTGYQSFFPQSIIRIFYISSGLKKSRTLTSSLRVFQATLSQTHGRCYVRGSLRMPGVYICSCAEAFQSGCCHCSSLLPLSWQLAAYICLNLSPLSRVQQVNERTHPATPSHPPTLSSPPLNSACTWDESE